MFLDLDGSLSGTANSHVTPHNPNLPSNCTKLVGFDVGHLQGNLCHQCYVLYYLTQFRNYVGVKCTGMKIHRVRLNNVGQSLLWWGNVELSNDWGSSSIPYQ